MKQNMDWWENTVKKGIRKWTEKHRNKMNIGKVGKELSCLHPGTAKRELETEYVTEKISKVMQVLTAGIFLSGIVLLAGGKNKILTEEGAIKRNEIGSTNQSVCLNAEVENRKYKEIPVEVGAK